MTGVVTTDRRSRPGRGRAGAVLAAVLMGAAGCQETKLTQPARSAAEQLAISTAADRAIALASFAAFAHQKVFLDTQYFDSYDAKYVIGALRDALSQAGALLVADAKESDVTLEARNGALSTDSADTLLGMPATGLPVPLAGPVALPEVALYKTQKLLATAKIALLAYDTRSREHLYSSGALAGKAYIKYFKLLFITYTATDIPEKRRRLPPSPPGAPKP